MSTVFDVQTGRAYALTPEQEAIREDFKAHAAEFLAGRAARDAVAGLIGTGLDARAASETVLEAVTELIEDGWDDYM